MKQHIFLLSLIFTAFGMASAQPQPQPQPQPISVSLIQLLATPERFEGKAVEVAGFLELEFESTALYLHKEDQQNRLLQNALWVNESQDMFQHRKNLHHRYVELVGIFTSTKHGHMGLFPGTLANIKWVTRVPGT